MSVRGTEFGSPRNRFHQRLRHATQPIHRRLEARLPLLDSRLTATRYRNLLRTFFGFYVPLEASMEKSAPPALSADVARRRKSRWLLEDLLSLGDSTQIIETLPLCGELPQMTSQADVLGALYVVEGATLGGQFVVTSLCNSLGRNADRSVRFFTSYGPRVPEMWSSLLRILEAAAYDELEEQAILASACRTFASFEQWLILHHGDKQSPVGCNQSDITSIRNVGEIPILNAP